MMSIRNMPGLFRRGDVWHIDKIIWGKRVRESTHARTLIEAEQYVIHRVEEVRQASVFGVRPERPFRDASEKYVKENQHKRSIQREIQELVLLEPFIGDLSLQSLHMGTLQTFIDFRKNQEVKHRTINYALQVIRQILNLASKEWIDEHGLTWLHHAPKIKLLPQHDAKKPYPLSIAEQELLFASLPLHLEHMALFAVNTGCRDQEICSLRWEWECQLEEFKTSVFVIPGEIVKNGEDRVVVLNRVAHSVIEAVRGIHPEFVFTYRGKPVLRMNNSAWISARKRVGLDVRVHDLKHTFGRRLRAAGVSDETLKFLLGHKSRDISTHYSAPEIQGLIDAANRACDLKRSAPILRAIKNRSTLGPTKSPQRKNCSVEKVM